MRFVYVGDCFVCEQLDIMNIKELDIFIFCIIFSSLFFKPVKAFLNRGV